MYGFPLTIYLLGHFVGIRIPLDHISGHLLGDLITYVGLGNGWFIVMTLSNVLLIVGIWLVMNGWERVYKSQGDLVIDGAYKYVRHPQYTGIFIITLGFMIQWPTLTTLILWPFVIAMYVRLARKEERGRAQGLSSKRTGSIWIVTRCSFLGFCQGGQSSPNNRRPLLLRRQPT